MTMPRRASTIPGPAGRMHIANRADDLSRSAYSQVPTPATPGPVKSEACVFLESLPVAPLLSPAWAALCTALDLRAPLAGPKDSLTSIHAALSRHAAELRQALGCSLFEVGEGAYDWTVPQLAAVVEHSEQAADGMWVLRLRDPSAVARCASVC